MNPVALPAEFYDTLGSIQQAVGLTREAEQSYLSGLRKSENHAVLNYHFGKMIAGDPSQALKAKAHLNKAIASRDKLAPPMAEEAMHLIQVIDQQRRGPRETPDREAHSAVTGQPRSEDEPSRSLTRVVWCDLDRSR